MNSNGIFGTTVVLLTITVIAFSLVSLGWDDGHSGSDDDGLTSDLVVYGNANGDNRLDRADLDFIASIVSGDVEWDVRAFPYADANVDGRVDTEDMRVVDQFLKGEEAIMYYTDWNRGVSKIHFPVVGGIGVAYEAGLDAGVLGGWYGQITAINKLPSEISKLDTGMYPGSHSLKSIKADTKVYDYEMLVDSGISLATGEPFAFDSSLIRLLDGHNDAVDRSGGDGYIDALLLPYSRDVNGINWTHTIHVLGVLTGHQDEVAEYFQYAESVESNIHDVLGGTHGPQEKTYLAIFVGSTVFNESGTEFAVEYYIDGKENSGDVVNLEKLPLRGANPKPMQTFDTLTIQQVIEMDPDVIFLINSKNDLTIQQLKDVFGDYVGYLEMTRACREGNMIWCNFDVLGSSAGVSMLTYLASMIWPGDFDRKDGLASMQDYFDRFTNLEADVSDTRFLPLGMSDLV